ncbi:MOSC domain-containing protein [Nitratifractor sp.]|uniref:MOSC domain-containing protein n=1 Tax=Nitratifractor sp. TaxID=2268144 RepID=UPI0025F8D6D6|nr:MOSC domain-containing protein [Nitratifractor sp.]
MEILRLFLAEPEKKGRSECSEITLDPQGVLGDKFYGKKLDRSILVTGTLAYEIARKEGIELHPGDLGENILVDLDTRRVAPGDRLISGEVILEATRPCTICEHLAIYDPRLPRLVKETRGVYLQVIQGGRLARGDRMELVKSES